MKSYTHFTLDERICLQKLFSEGLSMRKIASILGRSPSTIFRIFLYAALQSRAERLGRNGHVRKERSVNVPVRFTFISAADYFEDPIRQAEYMYGLIKTEVTNIE